jgi:hypothetical protein
MRIFETRGQDVAEYCLITAVIVLISLGIFLFVTGGVAGVWTVTRH